MIILYMCEFNDTELARRIKNTLENKTFSQDGLNVNHMRCIIDLYGGNSSGDKEALKQELSIIYYTFLDSHGPQRPQVAERPQRIQAPQRRQAPQRPQLPQRPEAREIDERQRELTDMHRMYSRALDEILRQQAGVSVIYVGIGSARNYKQQCPPYLSNFRGKKICVLIDKELESPFESPLKCRPDRDTIIIQITQHYYAQNYTVTHPDKVAICSSFLYSLVEHVLANNKKLIISDFSDGSYGPKMEEVIDIFGPDRIFPNILFDVSYGDENIHEGCHSRLSLVNIIKDRFGNFVQPMYSPLSDVKQYITPKYYNMFIKVARKRYNIIKDFMKGAGFPEELKIIETIYGSDLNKAPALFLNDIANVLGKRIEIPYDLTYDVFTAMGNDLRRDLSKMMPPPASSGDLGDPDH